MGPDHRAGRTLSLLNNFGAGLACGVGEALEEVRAANLADPFHAVRIARLNSGERFMTKGARHMPATGAMSRIKLKLSLSYRFALITADVLIMPSV